MSQPAAQPHTWAVTGQEEEPTVNSDMEPSTIHHVTFKTNTGHQSSVAIPDEQFTAANVAKAIVAKAREINTVHTLTSTNAPSATE